MFQKTRWICISTLLLWCFSSTGSYALGRKGPPAPKTPDGLSMRAVEIPRKSAWLPVGEQLQVQFDEHTLLFKPGSRITEMDGIRVWLHEGFRFEEGRGWLHPADYRGILLPLVKPDEQKQRPQRVVLDPGHGGEDSGAVSPNGLLEKERALTLCRKVAVALRKQGVDVQLTRVSDIALPLEKRGERAREMNAEVFISVHLNKSGSAGASGIETFVLTEPGLRSSNGTSHHEAESEGAADDPGLLYRSENMRLGFLMQQALVKDSNVVDRGLKRARFRVLRDAPCPAALIECGFISNSEEEKRFATNEYMDYIARRITQGILAYLAEGQ